MLVCDWCLDTDDVQDVGFLTDEKLPQHHALLPDRVGNPGVVGCAELCAACKDSLMSHLCRVAREVYETRVRVPARRD